ncbi:MAG: methenyltetrahydromethanopterin cyclohydrolase [Candidatus Oxydemutatoraceae bacterium WSBS_2016_MAG_OTU14]
MDLVPSINQLSAQRVKALCESSHILRLAVKRCDKGARLIDAGINALGGIEAGRQIAEICMGGLGQVTIHSEQAYPQWTPLITVQSSQPVLACLASQYAGWSLNSKVEKFSALGSGPARALAQKEPLFKELRYEDGADCSVLVLEADQFPPQDVIDYVAAACGLKHEQLTFIITPTSSLAGSFQVVARVLEVALHKAHALGFALESIVDGIGSVPLAPPASDFITGMGRTNDAILFGGRVHLFVAGDQQEAQTLAEKLPSNTSRDYGKPFAEVFKKYAYDFFKIDEMLFSPAMVAVTHLPSGKTFHAGATDMELLNQSFNS